MNEKVLVAVSAYAGDQNQVENNLPVYKHHQYPVLILSPKDAPIVKIDGAVCAIAGEKGWIGQQTLARQREFLKMLANEPGDWILFNDADSVCLSPKLPSYLFRDPMIFWSNEVLDTNTSPSKLPKLAFQPPYFFSKTACRALVRASATPALSFVNPTAEGEMPIPTDCIDHWMMQIVYSAGLQHRSFPDGASFETTSDHGLNTMRHHVEDLGKVFIHQVKTGFVLQALQEARFRYLKKRNK